MTKEFKPLDPLHLALSGTILIEASAGTGKTHTIASLVLRLVVERGIPIEKILVVTFTEAASAELKERIYFRLSDMLSALEGRSCKEAFSRDLAENLPKLSITISAAKSRILAALRNFDRSLIGTIHAFCSRMLKENRFESGMRFDADLVKDASFLLKKAAQDVWRMEVVLLDEVEARFFVMDRLDPDRLAKLAESYGKPDQKMLPEERPLPDPRALQGIFEKSASAVRKCWQENSDHLKKLLVKNPALNGNKLRQTTLEKGFALLDQWAPGVSAPEILSKLTPDFLRRATNKGKTTPSHPFFDLCSHCVEVENKFTQERNMAKALFLRHLISKTRERADFLKEKNGVFIYDDLLYRMREAVLKEGTGMAERIRSLFGAALIDEFQDTDTVQYAIFDRVFGNAGKPLFLIGDPKQAIYSFRGADVFAYLRAAATSENRYTLEKNWRSDPELIHAVNRIFEKNPKAFVLDGLDFHPVSAAERERETFKDEADPVPLRIWKVDVKDDGTPLNLPVMRKHVIHAMADEIIRLVEGGRNGSVCIGERGVGPGDIAVIVRKNDDARAVREAFSKRGIPAVIQAEGNLLDSLEADDLEILLEAILNPTNTSLIRRALATELLAFPLSKIMRLNEDEKAFAEIFTVFSEARELWRKKGIFPMLMDFYGKFDIPAAQASFPMGERRVTNLLHLAEILHQAEITENLDAGLLFRWFSRQRVETSERRIEAPLRLESDEKRVRIVTIHKAKGLEYPIVFCPFIAEAINPLNSKNEEKILRYHDSDLEQVVHLDDGSDRDPEIDRCKEEERAEGIRLLYVAMTRARHKLYLAWGNIKDWEKSGAAWLFHGVKEKDSGKNQEEDFDFLEEGGDIAVSDLPVDTGRILGPERDFEGELTRSRHKPLEPELFRVTSFSSLAAGSNLDEARDVDGFAVSRPKREKGPEGGIFVFPAGSSPGTFMHAIFENIDFTLDTSHFQEVVEKLLPAHGYDPAWTPVIVEMVERVLNLPMGEDKLRLCEVPLKDQLRELDFYLPLKTFDPSAFGKLVRKITGEVCSGIPEKLEKIRFSKTEGYLRGIMDLVFRYKGKYYLLDWKSNHLGDSPEDYSPEKLGLEMARHLYTLQYHLYVLALDRHLSLHLTDYDYDRDFGGVFYVFLRGIDPDLSQEFGLFEEKPPKGRILELGELLLEEPGSGLAATRV